MSNFYIRQNLLSSNTPTLVKNEEGKPVFLLVGRWGSRGDVLSLYKMSGELVASIRQASLAFQIGAKFDLMLNFQKVGSLQRILSFNRDFYFVHKIGWVVVGDIPNHSYSIRQLNKKIMEMEKVYHATGDYYMLNVMDDNDAPLCICIASVLDYWLINRDKTKNYLNKNFRTLEFD